MTTNVILIHGAFADSSSWDGVIPQLRGAGNRVIAWANPLRSVASDAAALTSLVRSLDGPVLLVGHSYGGAVMTNVPRDAGDMVGLVYVAAFALAEHESAGEAASLAPGSTLAETLQPVPLADGGVDMYILQDRYHAQFAADLSADQAALMAATQRPITEAALSEPSGGTPLWWSVPSWFVFGEQDRNIPAGAHHVMAQRADSRRTLEVPGASHVVGISHPDVIVQMVTEAAAGKPSVDA
jgi:pimeloyl-ACP methyl ester carboxylesterase